MSVGKAILILLFELSVFSSDLTVIVNVSASGRSLEGSGIGIGGGFF
jgi:hypothetical protein